MLREGNSQIELIIWDIGGQERFHPIVNQYFPSNAGAMLVYSLSDRESFTRIPFWASRVRLTAEMTVVM